MLHRPIIRSLARTQRRHRQCFLRTTSQGDVWKGSIYHIISCLTTSRSLQLLRPKHGLRRARNCYSQLRLSSRKICCCKHLGVYEACHQPSIIGALYCDSATIFQYYENHELDRRCQRAGKFQQWGLEVRAPIGQTSFSKRFPSPCRKLKITLQTAFHNSNLLQQL
jgi:hypothetical protein